MENSPTTLPFALDSGLNEVLDFSPPRLDGPGIELDAHRTPALLTENSREQMSAAPTTQFQLQASPLAILAPTTLPDATTNERVDVVIVLEAEPAAIPATLPATTEPAP